MANLMQDLLRQIWEIAPLVTFLFAIAAGFHRSSWAILLMLAAIFMRLP